MKGLDTNVLVRFLVQDDKAQGAAAVAYIARHCTAAEPGFINRIVLCELVWVLESVYDYSRVIVGDAIERILRTEEFQVEDNDEARVALAIYRRTGVDFADALIGRGNRALGCSATATFDRKAASLDEFELVSEARR